MYKSHTCGELRGNHEGQSVTLAGWVNRRRDHGGVTFMDLRDRSGLVQIVASPQIEVEAQKKLEHVRMEWVLPCPRARGLTAATTGRASRVAHPARWLPRVSVPFQLVGRRWRSDR